MNRKASIVCALASTLSVLAATSATAQTLSSAPPKNLPPLTTGVAQAGALTLGAEEPCNVAPGCLFYAGDFDAAGPNPNGLWNSNNTLFGIAGTVYVPFTVPKKYKGAKGKTDWVVQGLFVNEQMEDLTGGGYAVSSADWSIVQGVAAGGQPNGPQITTICSGTSESVTLTATGRIAFGLPEYTLLVSGVSCPTLENGTYWLTLLPTTLDIGYISDVEDSIPANAVGPGSEPIDDSFFVSASFGFPTFSDAAGSVCGGIGCDAFSAGIIATATH